MKTSDVRTWLLELRTDATNRPRIDRDIEEDRKIAEHIVRIFELLHQVPASGEGRSYEHREAYIAELLRERQVGLDLIRARVEVARKRQAQAEPA